MEFSKIIKTKQLLLNKNKNSLKVKKKYFYQPKIILLKILPHNSEEARFQTELTLLQEKMILNQIQSIHKFCSTKTFLL